MPNMADITVKKADGTTDVVFSKLSPSAGDTVPASWRCESVGNAPGLRPTLSLVTKWNGPKTARVITGNFVYPEIVTDSVTSTSKVRNRVPITITATVPVEVPSTTADEAISQCMNLFDSALIVESFKTGFAPT